MKMININRELVGLKDTINQNTSWEQLAEVINFATELQGKALEVAIHKGLSEELTQKEIIGRLRISGCKLSDNQLFNLISYHNFKIELSGLGTQIDGLKIPNTSELERRLGKGVESTSAIEKAEEFTELYEEKGAAPTRAEIEASARIKAKARKQMGRDGRREELPQYLSAEEIIEFREWCKENDVDIEANKPKVSVIALTQEKDDVIDELFNHIGEWKTARKIMFDRLHPDKGGNTLAFQFVKMFDELMKALLSLLEWVEYEDAVIAYKKEWWRNRK